MSGHDERERCALLWAIERIDGTTHHLEVNHERKAGVWWAPHGHPATWSEERTRASLATGFDVGRASLLRMKGGG